MFKIKTKLI